MFQPWLGVINSFFIIRVFILPFIYPFIILRVSFPCGARLWGK